MTLGYVVALCKTEHNVRILCLFYRELDTLNKRSPVYSQ